MKRAFFFSLILAAGSAFAGPEEVARAYQILKVNAPAGLAPEIGGMDLMPDGRIAVAFLRGEIAFFDPVTGSWQMFARGLHEPLGLVVEDASTVVVMQRPELTRIRDEDGDGSADLYETVWDGFGLTGNYHEFAFGPVRGPDGAYYVSLNVASNGASIAPEIRGEFDPNGITREEFARWSGDDKKKAGRMYSRVPYRGWVMRIDPKTGKAEPFASGFRSPDGLGFDKDGRLLVDDNQGDWRGTSPLYHVEKGGFYGHPASLVWSEGWNKGNPLALPVAELEAMRTKPGVEFTHGLMANSPTQIVLIPSMAGWEPFAGQLLVGEMNQPRILRVIPEVVGGIWQGACVPHIQHPLLGNGCHRMVFDKQGRLWTGHIHRSWAGGEHLRRIKPLEEVPFTFQDLRLVKDGFRFQFTKAVNTATFPEKLFATKRYRYHYHSAYGSPQVETATLVPTNLEWSEGNTVATVRYDGMAADFVYEFTLKGGAAAKGEALLHETICYTARKIPE